MLEREYSFLEKNRSALLEKYRDKYIVIADDAVFGAFDDQGSAYAAAIIKYKPGQFLIEHLVADKEKAIQRFTSLVYV